MTAKERWRRLRAIKWKRGGKSELRGESRGSRGGCGRSRAAASSGARAVASRAGRARPVVSPAATRLWRAARYYRKVQQCAGVHGPGPGVVKKGAMALGEGRVPCVVSRGEGEAWSAERRGRRAWTGAHLGWRAPSFGAWGRAGEVGQVGGRGQVQLRREGSRGGGGARTRGLQMSMAARGRRVMGQLPDAASGRRSEGADSLRFMNCQVANEMLRRARGSAAVSTASLAGGAQTDRGATHLFIGMTLSQPMPRPT